MPRKQRSIEKMTNTLFAKNKDYRTYFESLKERIRTAQLKAARVVNTELVCLYWELGKSIGERQKSAKWGSGFLETLSKDLQSEFPGMSGFSETNLRRMLRFSENYPILPIPPQPVAELPWGHISVLNERIKDATERSWYATQAVEYGWSRNVLLMQIETDLFSRQGKARKKLSNFKDRLPPFQSDLAEESLKDPYIFDFLTVGKDAHEREIEKELTNHITKFLLELGTGFAFIGSQVPITVGKQDFFIDMLFYHMKLRSFVVIELKAQAFKPEHTGQLNFYLSAVDEKMRHPSDNPTIGILLCKSRDKVVAEYALRNVHSPMGISEYKLTRMMPKELKTSLPTIAEIEAELSSDVKPRRKKPKR